MTDKRSKEARKKKRESEQEEYNRFVRAEMEYFEDDG